MAALVATKCNPVIATFYRRLLDAGKVKKVEGKNNRINTIKRMAYGYRNMANFRLRMLATNSKGSRVVSHLLT